MLVYEFASGGGFGDLPPPPTLLREGRAMRDALCRDLLAAGLSCATAASPLARAPAGCEAHTPEPGEAAAEFLARIAPGHDAIWAIAPESDGIALALTRRIEDIGIPWLGCRGQAVELASSKSRCLARLASAGIAVVPTWPLASAPLAAHPLWVVKPDIGCGCEAMWRLTESQARRYAGEAIAQPWLDGQAMSLSLLVGDGTTELLAVNRQCIDIDADGALSRAGIERRGELPAALMARLAALARQVAAAIPGLAGFVGIDFVLTPAGEPVVIEVNPRPTAAYVGLSAALGRNLARAIIAALAPQLFAPCRHRPTGSAGMSAAPI